VLTAIQLTILLTLAVGIQIAEIVRRHILGARLEQSLRTVPVPVRRD
jgi:hypothetical protein